MGRDVYKRQTLQRARDITVDAIDDFKSGKLDEIYIVYTKIQNALTSEPVMERLLPMDRRFLQPAPKCLGDPKGEVELVPDAWTVFPYQDNGFYTVDSQYDPEGIFNDWYFYQAEMAFSLLHIFSRRV